jgi:hypothetical protein
VRPETPASHEQALSWFEAGHTTLLAAVTQAAASDPGAATRAWREALDILIGLGHPDADELRTRLSEVSLSARPGGRR